MIKPTIFAIGYIGMSWEEVMGWDPRSSKDPNFTDGNECGARFSSVTVVTTYPIQRDACMTAFQRAFPEIKFSLMSITWIWGSIFVGEIEQRVASCDVLIAVIGRHWLVTSMSKEDVGWIIRQILCVSKLGPR